MVKLLGHIVPDGERLWLVSSASEIGFRVRNATYAELVLCADDTVNSPETETLRPRFAVLVDGKKILDARMAAKEETVCVFRDDGRREAEVRLIKLSEATQSLMALREIRTDGTLEALPEKPLKMEFIGDSITCGYGVEGKNELETFTTATENAGKGYACLTAGALDADAVLTCFSGHGIVSGYTADPAVRDTEDLVPPYYDREGRNAFRLPNGKRVEEIRRDFSAFRPDCIVVNLGTNDLSWCQEDPERGALFAREYAAFLREIRGYNPEARILCILGVMGTGLNAMMQRAAEDYCRETGDGQLRVLLLEEQNAARDGYGSDFHPNEISQRLLADRVTDAIRRWMKL